MKAPPLLRNLLFGVAGAVAGGSFGYIAFFWIAQQGLYALIVPGAMLGIGAGLAARQRIVPLAILCAFAGLILGIVTEWRFAPFRADPGLLYFVTHLHQCKPFTLILIGLGGYFSYRLALGFNKQ